MYQRRIVLKSNYVASNRYAQYMNFSHPLIKEKFDPNACGWAYGMNFFDLDAWRKEKCTEQYHYWQNLVCELDFSSFDFYKNIGRN